MPCGWEGNRRSGVALAMRHRLQWFIHLQAQGLSKGDEQWHNTFYLYYTDALSYVSYHTNMSLLIELDYT